jgi:hypothetical protein
MMMHWKIEGQETERSLNTLQLEYKGLFTAGGRFEKWRHRLHAGLYQIIIAGAVAYREYNAPFFFAEKEGPEGFLERCRQTTKAHSALNGDDYDYFRKIPVYNCRLDDGTLPAIKRDEEFRKTFGAFAEWLIKEGARKGHADNLKGCEIPDTDEDEDLDLAEFVSFDVDQAGSIREIKTLIGVYEHFHLKLSPRSEDEPAQQAKPRTVNAVVFGKFQLHEIVLPETLEEAESCYLFHKNLSASPRGQGVLIFTRSYGR